MIADVLGLPGHHTTGQEKACPMQQIDMTTEHTHPALSKLDRQARGLRERRESRLATHPLYKARPPAGLGGDGAEKPLRSRSLFLQGT